MMKAVSVLASAGLALAVVCDEYCSNPASGYCTQSPLYDGTTKLPDSSGGTYLKCASKHDQTPILCPPVMPPLGCETCGMSWSSAGFEPFLAVNDCCPGVMTDGYRYGYDYDWNIAKAKRNAYSDTNVGCFFFCDAGYACRDRSYWGYGKCKIAADTKFYGEVCSNSDECNTITQNHVNMVCSSVSKTCLLKEEAARQPTAGRVECSCSVLDHGTVGGFFTGLLYCKNNEECGGNMCSRTTQDMKMYCSKDEAHSAKCSNCRAADDACKSNAGSARLR